MYMLGRRDHVSVLLKYVLCIYQTKMNHVCVSVKVSYVYARLKEFCICWVNGTVAVLV